MSDPAPTVLGGRYEVRDLLGQGGMATVYRGFDRTLQRDVAIKVMRPTLAGDVDRERFAAEARVLASLSDAHLVTLLDAGIDRSGSAERPWLVMELIEGPSLARRIAAGPLGPAETAQIGAALASALAHVHANGIVHRDVKPANILLTAAGAAKLADFGVARMTGEMSDLTGTGQTIGTAAYLAPEQVMGSPVTGATDVYALGLVLLEALTGTRAYPGPATEAALARLHRSPLLPISLGSGWVRLLDEMTASQPSDRPTAAQAATRLAVLSGAGSTQPAPIVLDDPTGTIPLPGLRGTGTRVAPVPVRRAPAAPPRRRWSRTVALAAAGVAAVLVLATGAAWLHGGSDPTTPTDPDAVATQPAVATSPTASATPKPAAPTTSSQAVAKVSGPKAAHPGKPAKKLGKPHGKAKGPNKGKKK